MDPAGTHRAAAAGIATFEDLRIDQVRWLHTRRIRGRNQGRNEGAVRRDPVVGPAPPWGFHRARCRRGASRAYAAIANSRYTFPLSA